MPSLGQLELLAKAKSQVSFDLHKQERQRHTRVNRAVSSIDSLSRQVEIVVNRREGTAGATKVGNLATMDSRGSILDIAQGVSGAVIGIDTSICQSLNTKHNVRH